MFKKKEPEEKLKSNRLQKVEFEAQAFARMFTNEYFTYDNSINNDETYIQRLNKYSNLEFQLPVKRVKSEVKNIEAYRIERQGDKAVNVYCKVAVKCNIQQDLTQFPPSIPVQPLPTPKQMDEIYLKIPVAENNGLYCVDGYPLFLPEEKQSGKPSESIQGKDVNEDTRQDIISMLESFLKAYCTGSNTEISYFMQDARDIEGLNGQFDFKELKTTDLVIKENAGQYLYRY